ncbi:MAG: hypothetical protein WB815_05865 [Nitrososphaeraceae archaeon]
MDSTRKIFLPSISSENNVSKPKTKLITITKCLSLHCTGFYTDSVSESILIKCSDPKHNTDEAGDQPAHNETSLDTNSQRRSATNENEVECYGSK